MGREIVKTRKGFCIYNARQVYIIFGEWLMYERLIPVDTREGYERLRERLRGMSKVCESVSV